LLDINGTKSAKLTLKFVYNLSFDCWWGVGKWMFCWAKYCYYGVRR